MITSAGKGIENGCSYCTTHIQPAPDKVPETQDPEYESRIEIDCLSVKDGERGVAEPLHSIAEEPSSTGPSTEILLARPHIYDSSQIWWAYTRTADLSLDSPPSLHSVPKGGDPLNSNWVALHTRGSYKDSPAHTERYSSTVPYQSRPLIFSLPQSVEA